jgi:hypothetical protein
MRKRRPDASHDPHAPGDAVAFRWEADMTEVVATSIGSLVPPRSPAPVVLREVRGAVGVVDLVAVNFDDDALGSRICTGLRPMTLPLRVRVLDALGARVLRVSTLARRTGRNPTALMRSTLTPLVELGAIEMHHGKVAATGAWRPVTSRLTAVELKLAKWRAALRQADNAALSTDAAWVVLDGTKACAATAAVEVFRDYGVGLATIEPSGALEISCRPRGRRTVRWLHAWMGELAWAALRTDVEAECAVCSQQRPPRVQETRGHPAAKGRRKSIAECDGCVEAIAHASRPGGGRQARELVAKLKGHPDLV